MFGVGYSALATDASMAMLLGPAGQAAGVYTWSILVKQVVAILCAGMAIRLMDDVVDRASDKSIGLVTSVDQLADTALVYALAALATGAFLAPALVGALFLAAYAVGMGGDLKRRLPSGLSGYQESVLVIAIGIAGAGVWIMSWAVAVMVALQAIDDLRDLTIDGRTGSRNMCQVLGQGEVILLGLLALLTSLNLSLALTSVALLIAVTVSWATRGKPREARTNVWWGG